MVRRRDQGGRILHSGLDVMYRRVGIKRLKLRFVIARSVVRNPVPADRELVKPEHVHDARLLDHGLE